MNLKTLFNVKVRCYFVFFLFFDFLHCYTFVIQIKMPVSDEELSETIRRFPVLFDKNAKGHRDKLIVKNAWEEVVKSCDLESIKEAQRLFTNLKKRFNKRRKESKGASGSGTQDLREARERFKDMEYLAWLEPFIKLRATKSNIKFKELLNNVESESDDDDSLSLCPTEDPESPCMVESNVPDSQLPLPLPTILPDFSPENDSESVKKSNAPKSKCKTKTSKTSEITGRQKWHQKKDDDLDSIQREFLSEARDALKKTKEPDNTQECSPNMNFGKYIVNELDQLPAKYQRKAKHEMVNILYSYQDKAEEENTQQLYNSAQFNPYLHRVPQTQPFLRRQHPNRVHEECHFDFGTPRINPQIPSTPRKTACYFNQTAVNSGPNETQPTQTAAFINESLLSSPMY